MQLKDDGPQDAQPIPARGVSPGVFGCFRLDDGGGKSDLMIGVRSSL